MAIKFGSVPTKTLSESITSSATSFKLSDIEGWGGSDLTSADFGSTAYGVFRNANRTEVEFFEFDPATIASSSITITRRGLSYAPADLTTEVSANKKSWTRGDTFVDIGTDSPQVLQWLKEYIDAASIAGAVPATNAVQGITKLSVAAASASNPIAVGDNDPRLPTADENNAMAGGGDFGTPSTSNKFLTQEYPRSKLLAMAVNQTVDNSVGTTETNLFSVTVPANTVASGRAIKFTATISSLTWNSGSDTITFRFKFGGTTLATSVITGTSNNNMKGVIEGYLYANGNSAQVGAMRIDLSEVVTTQVAIGSATGEMARDFKNGTSAIDATASQTLALSVQRSDAVAAQAVTVLGYTIESIT